MYIIVSFVLYIILDSGATHQNERTSGNIVWSLFVPKVKSTFQDRLAAKEFWICRKILRAKLTTNWLHMLLFIALFTAQDFLCKSRISLQQVYLRRYLLPSLQTGTRQYSHLLSLSDV